MSEEKDPYVTAEECKKYVRVRPPIIPPMIYTMKKGKDGIWRVDRSLIGYMFFDEVSEVHAEVWEALIDLLEKKP
jgi:hypothetical protein